MENDSITQRLQNWAWYVTWGVVGPQPDTTCRSFEKNYVPELGSLYEPEEPHYEPDHQDGDLIEQTIKGLPLNQRQVLKLRYVSHPYASINQLAHAARTTVHKLEQDISNAKKRLQHELDKKRKAAHGADLCKLQD
jgi:DNA-directed RNA polymerase specialized sigma24 family protein